MAHNIKIEAVCMQMMLVICVQNISSSGDWNSDTLLFSMFSPFMVSLLN